MSGPKDPMSGGYAKSTPEPVKRTGAVGPQARGATEKRHQDTHAPSSTNIAAGEMRPSAKQK